MKTSALAVASVSFAGSLGFAGLAYNSVQIFLLHKTDEKWGDKWGNFSLATTLLLFLLAGSVAGFILVWIGLRTGRVTHGNRGALRLGVAAGVVAWVIAVVGFGWRISSFVGLNSPGVEMAIETGLPGVLAGVACTGVLRLRTQVRPGSRGGVK